MDIKTELSQTLDAFFSGGITAEQAATTIDSKIGGLTGFDYRTGLKFTIENHLQRYSLGAPSDRHSQKKIVQELVPAMQPYCKGRGEAHISKYQSTKHHCA